MLGNSVEKLFERYRRKGDPSALAEVFDRTAPELLRLAQHLVRDATRADDVLQETFVAAIDAADRWDGTRPLVPWLMGILARQASMQRRRDRRTLDAGRLRDEPREDPSERAAENELSAALVAALRELPPLYREVLHRHLVEGAKPAEIAHATGRAPGTVRMQLYRGLEQLRKSLPAGLVAGAALATLAPRGLSAVREAVVAHAVQAAPAVVAACGAAAGAATGAAAGAATGAKALAGAGTSLWITKLAVLGVLGALAAFATFVWRRDPASADRATRDAPASSASLTGASGPHAIAWDDDYAWSANRMAAESAAALVAPRAPTLALTGRVSGLAADQMGEARVEVRGIARGEWPDDAVARGVPSEDGRYEIDLGPLMAEAARRGGVRALEVSASHPQRLVARAVVEPDAAVEAAVERAGPPGAVLQRDLELQPAALVEGAVHADGLPVAGAEVLLVRVVDGAPVGALLDRAASSPDGRFLLRAAEAEACAVLACAPGHRPIWVPVELRVGTLASAAALAFPPARQLTGSLRGALAGDVLLSCRPVSANGPAQHDSSMGLASAGAVWNGEGLAWRRLLVRAEASGRFTFSGLADGPCVLRAERLGDDTPILGALDPSEDACARDVDAFARELDWTLDLARVELNVLDADGHPARGVRVVDLSRPSERLERASGVALGGAAQDDEPPQGRVRLARPLRAACAVEVSCPGHVARRVDLDSRGPSTRTLRLERESAGARVTLQVRSPGSALVYVTVARLDGAKRAERHEVLNGAVELSGLAAGPLRLELFANGAWNHLEDMLLPAVVELDIQGVAGEHQTRAIAFERGGALRLRATDAAAAAGAALPARVLVRDAFGTAQAVRFLLASGDRTRAAPGAELSDSGWSESVPRLRPGLYEVECIQEGRTPSRARVQIEAGRTTELEFALH